MIKEGNFTVLLHQEFISEFMEFEQGLQDELLSHLKTLEYFGPQLGRPRVDTLKGSEFSNMKELRFLYKRHPWRFAFVFDVKRKAVVLVGGDKKGVNQKRFYRQLIAVADSRFRSHSAALKSGGY